MFKVPDTYVNLICNPSYTEDCKYLLRHQIIYINHLHTCIPEKHSIIRAVMHLYQDMHLYLTHMTNPFSLVYGSWVGRFILLQLVLWHLGISKLGFLIDYGLSSLAPVVKLLRVRATKADLARLGVYVWVK